VAAPERSGMAAPSLLPPACANAAELETASAVASRIVLIFIAISSKIENG
jgi:hypothetical protein